MMQRLRRFYWTQQFDPGLLGAFVNPFFLARRSLRRAVTTMAADLGGSLLDVGCGSQPYRPLFDVRSYCGLELDTPEARARRIADAYYDGETFPFEAHAFDSVLCNQVLEHVFNPDRFLAEIRRVTAPGGRLLLTVPFVWDEHEQPHDFARYSSFGLRDLLERNGFRVLVHRKLMADCSLLFQLAIAYLFKVLCTRRRGVALALTALLFAPLSLAGLALGRLLPRNPDLFLDQIVLAERLP